MIMACDVASELISGIMEQIAVANANHGWIGLRDPYHLDEKREQMNYTATIDAASMK